MKESYFTDDNIAEVSNEMLKSLEYSFVERVTPFVPESSALLVLDMQNFFLDDQSHAYIPSTAPIIGNISRLIDLYSQNDLPVIFTRHVNTKADAKLMSTWWRDILKEGDPLSEITPSLNQANAKLITKSQYDAFFETKLESILNEAGVKQLVVTGVMTHLCCETTARAAFVRGYEVFFPVDGTATYNRDFHRSSFLTLSHGFVVPTLVDSLVGELK